MRWRRLNKLRQLEAAAPYIDALNEASRGDADSTSMAAMSASFRNMLGAVLPGINKNDPSVTLESLVDDFDPAQWSELRAAFDAIFRASGVAEGEAQAPAAVDPAAA